MVDEVLFAGGRIDSLGVSGSPTESTSGTRFNNTYADCGILHSATSDILTATFLTLSGTVMVPTDVVTGETLYVHYDRYDFWNAAPSNTNTVLLYDSSGFPWLAIRTVTNANIGLFYNSNTGASPTWTQIGSTIAHTSALYTFDIKLTLGSPHAVELSINGSRIISSTFTQALLTSLRSVRMNGNGGSGTNQTSQILCTRGISTIGAFVKYSRPTAAGTNSGWSGAYTDVNEVVGSDVTLNTAGSSGLKQSYAMGDVTVPVGYAIAAVFNFFRAKNSGGVPLNIKSLLRSSSTDYSSGALTQPTFGTSFAAMGMRYEVDPATSAAWTQAGWNAAEAGFESLT